MRKLLLGLTLLFALEAHAGDPNGLDDDTRDALTAISLLPVIFLGIVVIGGVIVIADQINEESSDFAFHDNNYMFHYDPHANAIIFSDDSNLEKYEIYSLNKENYNFQREKYLSNDFLAKKIIFRTGTDLDNLEINLSKPFKNSYYEFMPYRFEEHYFGFTWKY